jgi:hypothetical protein
VNTPGAVAFQPSQPVPTTQATVVSQAEEDAMIKARAATSSRRRAKQQAPEPMSMRGKSMTQAKLDFAAKARECGSTIASHQRENSRAMDNNSVVHTNKAATTAKGSVITNIAQEEPERHYDMPMAQTDQQNCDNRENCGTASEPEDDIYGSGKEQPTTMQSPGLPDKQDDFDIMDLSTPPSGDRGMDVLSDLEYGQSRINESELAVAIAVDEGVEEEEKVYAYAVKQFPDSKPPFYQNRRCRLYGIVGSVCFVVLMVLLSATIVVTGKNSSKGLETTLAPTMSPTTERENAYRKYFASVVGEKIYQPGTPHYSAANWIISEDPMPMSATDSNRLQRFMMAFLYFHTTDNGKAPWLSCNPPKKGEDDTCVALEFTRQPDDSITYVPRSGGTRWLSGQDECNWNGVECGGGPSILAFHLSKVWSSLLFQYVPSSFNYSHHSLSLSYSGTELNRNTSKRAGATPTFARYLNALQPAKWYYSF